MRPVRLSLSNKEAHLQAQQGPPKGSRASRMRDNGAGRSAIGSADMSLVN